MGDNPVQIGEDMSEAEIRSLLTRIGHGVLSLGNDDDGYGIPISYGYDEADDQCIFEFLTIGGSKKETFVTESDQVTLTVYEYENPQSWASVIVTGTIEEIAASEIPERSVSGFAEHGEDGAEDIRWTGAEEMDRDWYVLEPEEITGRSES